MHELAIPQTYVPGLSDDDPGLRVIAVERIEEALEQARALSMG